MKGIIIISLLVLSGLSYGQHVIKYTPQYVPKTNTETDILLFKEMLDKRDAHYERNRDLLYNIQNSILDQISATLDEKVLHILNKYYKKLEALKGQDYAEMDNLLREIPMSLKRELIEYNASLQAVDNNLIGIILEVKSACIIHLEPDLSSKIVKCIKRGEKVQFIRNVNNSWCFVKYGEYEGYTLKGYLNY